MSDDAFKHCERCNHIGPRLLQVQEDNEMLLLAVETLLSGKTELTPAERLLAAVAAKVRGSR
jgi:hypothetical protein